MILLDTHTLIWLRLDSQQLGAAARRAIDEHWRLGQVYVSAISFWEIAMLAHKGKIEFAQDINIWHKEVVLQGLGEIPISGKIGIEAAGLKNLHGDPADRIIVTTALLGGHQLITADRRLLGWSGQLNRLDAKT